MKLTESRLADVLAAIRSPAPTPGGGSASALAGAIGASLLAMVASMGRHRAQSEEDVDRLQEAGRRTTGIAEALADLADRDCEAYEQVMAAYRLPKTSEEDKADRSRATSPLSMAADAVHLDTTRLSIAEVVGRVLALVEERGTRAGGSAICRGGVTSVPPICCAGWGAARLLR